MSKEELYERNDGTRITMSITDSLIWLSILSITDLKSMLDFAEKEINRYKEEGEANNEEYTGELGYWEAVQDSCRDELINRIDKIFPRDNEH